MARYRVGFTPRALADIEKISKWWRANRASALRMFQNELVNIESHPEIGHSVELRAYPGAALRRRHARACARLRLMRSDLKWLVPTYWEELVDTKGQPGAWPEDLDLVDTPELVQRLARSALWLEQEPVAIDARTPAALEEMLPAAPRERNN